MGKFKLGMQVRDKASGVVGRLVSYTVYEFDAPLWGVQIQNEPSGKIGDTYHFAEARLEEYDGEERKDG